MLGSAVFTVILSFWKKRLVGVLIKRVTFYILQSIYKSIKIRRWFTFDQIKYLFRPVNKNREIIAKPYRRHFLMVWLNSTKILLAALQVSHIHFFLNFHIDILMLLIHQISINRQISDRCSRKNLWQFGSNSNSKLENPIFQECWKSFNRLESCPF